MTFLNPWMALGGLAVGIPIALHFFYRAHYRPLPWAAMKYLRLAMEQTSRRMRFQEVVLLILRALVCLLLALALTRPASKSLTAGGGRGQSVDAIIIIDNSYSMTAKENDKATRFDLAKEAAKKIIENLPPSSTVQIISCSDRAKNLGPYSPSNLDQARLIIDDLKPSSLSTDFEAGFREAVAAFHKSHGASKEVYLISDMQRSGWERQTSAIRSKCEEIKNQASLYLLRCGAEPLQNVAIVGIQPQGDIGVLPRIQDKGRDAPQIPPYSFTVLLRNTGTKAIENLNVSLSVDGQLDPEKTEGDAKKEPKENSQKDVDKNMAAVSRINPGETKAVAISLKFFGKPGWRRITARINEESDKGEEGAKNENKANRANEDAIKEDDAFSRMIYVFDKVRVLIVDGTPNIYEPEKAGSYNVGHALRPASVEKRSDHLISMTIIPPDQANAKSLADQDVCLLVNVPADPKQLPPEFAQSLEPFVRSGKGLFISTGNQVVGADYNAAFGRVLPVPLVDTGPVQAPKEAAFVPDMTSLDAFPFFARLKEKNRYDLLERTDLPKTKTEKVTAVEEPKNVVDKTEAARVLVRFNNGLPMLVGKRIGKGAVMLLTTSVDKSWADVCITPAFPLFINGCVSQLIEDSSESFNRVAGNTVHWAPPDLQQDYYLARPEGGEPVFLGKAADFEGEMCLPVFDAFNAGVYEIKLKDATSGDRLVFVPDLRESENLETLPDAKIDDQLGFQPVHLTTGFDGSAFKGNERNRKEWTIWVLTALLIFALGETLWAWFCGRSW